MRADLPNRTSSSPQTLRVGSVQLDYVPAIPECLEDPCYSLGQTPTLRLPSQVECPERVDAELGMLRRRVRDSYSQSLLQRLEGILATAQEWHVDLLLFPEYSIPFEILPRLAVIAPKIVVVAGTHTVERASAATYSRLGLETAQLLGTAVAPILHEGVLVGLIQKLHPSKLERDLRGGTSWSPVPIAQGNLKIGILICLDFLFRENAAYREIVGPQLETTDLLLVPSLTNTPSTATFWDRSWEESKHYKRPVVYANHALYGRTTVFADVVQRNDMLAFPNHVGVLQPGEEGLVVADLDIAKHRSGQSTEYGAIPTITPFALASFLYNGKDSEYDAWLTSATDALSLSSDVEKLDALASLVERQRPPAVNAPPSRAARLREVRRTAGELHNPETAVRLLREVRLPTSALDPGTLRSALCRGAAGAISALLKTADIPAVELQRMQVKLASEAERHNAPAPLQHVASDLARSVEGPTRASTERVPAIYLELVTDHILSDEKEAEALWQAGRYADAAKSYQSLLVTAERLLATADTSEHRTRAARHRLNSAISLLNIQELDEARDLLRTLDTAALAPSARALAALTFAQLRDLSRADELLRTTTPDTEQTSRLLREARLTLEVQRGRFSSELATAPNVRSFAAARLLEAGRLTEASRLATVTLLDSLESQDTLSIALSTQVLIGAIRRTILETADIADTIHPDERDNVVQCIGIGLELLKTRELPPPIKSSLDIDEFLYNFLVEGTAPDGARPDLEDKRMRDAVDLARRGQLDEAMSSVTADLRTWQGSLTVAQLHLSAGDRDTALRILLEARAVYPGKALIERLIAQLYQRVGNVADALPHAATTNRELPTTQSRLLLASCLAGVGDHEKAWTLISRDAQSRDERVLRLRALLADAIKPEIALEHWRAYLRAAPQDHEARIHLAQQLARFQHRLDAANEAWGVIEGFSDKLSAPELYACAALQRLLDDAPRARSRIRAIAETIRSRFPLDATAEQYRLNLLLSIGEPGNVDFKLLEGAGHVHKLNEDELIDFLTASRSVAASTYQLYQRGAISLQCFLDFTNQSLCEYVAQTHAVTGQPLGTFSCPVLVEDEPPFPSLAQAQLVVTEVELVFFQHLGLLETLVDQLDGGSLILRRSSWDRLLNDESEIARRVQPQGRQAHRRLLELVARLPRGRSDEGVPVATLALDSRPTILPHVLVRHLVEDGVADSGAFEKFASALPFVGPLPPPEPLPREFQLGVDAVMGLFESQLLGLLVTSARGALKIAEDAFQAIQATSDRYALADTSLTLARATLRTVADGIAAERIRIVRDPVVSIPTLRHGVDARVSRLVTEPLHDALAIKELVLENADRWRIVSDSFGITTQGDPQLLQYLEWHTPDEYLALSGSLRLAGRRSATLAMIVRRLRVDDAKRLSALERLASMGFIDAVLPAELVALESRFGSLSKDHPRQILDHVERLARIPNLLAAPMVRLRLARLYGETLFSSFVNAEVSPIRPATEPLGILLERAERLDAEMHTDLLEMTLAMIATLTADRWRHSWRVDGEHLNFDPHSTAAELWAKLATWSGPDGSRRAAFGRAVRSSWESLDRIFGEDGPPGPYAGALMNTMRFRPESPRSLTFLEPEIAVLAAVSAFWRHKPLSNQTVEVTNLERTSLRVSLESALAFGASIEWSPADVREVVRFDYWIESIGVHLPVYAFAEALMARSPPATRAVFAKALRQTQPVADATLHELLRAIEVDPSDEANLREYVRRAASSPYRLLRDDPSYILRWPTSLGLHPAHPEGWLAHLREILAEPGRNPVDETGWLQHTVDRVETGDLRNRDDNWFRLERMADVPGMLSPWWALQKMKGIDSHPEAIERALTILSSPNDYPAGRVAHSILLLRLTAGRSPLVNLARGQVDLRAILAEKLVSVLNACKSPPPDSFAARESTWLIACRVALGSGIHGLPMSTRDAVWLCHRMFSWLCTQESFVQTGYRTPLSVPSSGIPLDTFDPYNLVPSRFDLRLAVVLQALTVMNLLNHVVGEDSSTDLWRFSSSPSLIDALVDLAQSTPPGQTLSTTSLDWPSPTTIRELSVDALLTLSTDGLLRLSVPLRGALLSSIPLKLEPARLDVDFYMKLVVAFGESAGSLTPEEREHLEKLARSLDTSEYGERWRLMLLSNLLSAGRIDLLDEVVSITASHLPGPYATPIVGRILLGAVGQRPLAPIVETLRASARAKEAPFGSIIAGAIGRTLAFGPSSAHDELVAILTGLSNDPELGTDPDLRQLVQLLEPGEQHGP